MNRVIIIILFLFFPIYILFSFPTDEISDHPLEIVAKIEYGKEEGKLGLGVVQVGPNRTLWAGPMNWRENGEVYIIDGNNYRINVYNENFEYLRKINFGNDENKYFISYIRRMLVDENGNIIILIAGIDGPELIFINNSGNLKILLDHNTRSDVFHSQDFFSTGQELVYFEDYKDNIHLIDLYHKNELKRDDSKEIPWIIEKKTKSSFIKEKLPDQNGLLEFLKKNKTILYGNRLLTRDFSKYFRYKSYLKNKLKTEKSTEKFTITDKEKNAIFVGFDEDDNVYWKAYFIKGEPIIIFNKYGDIIDIVKSKRIGMPSISPAGDIYYFGVEENNKKNVIIYKIPRRW